MALWRIIKDNNIVEDFASFTVHCFKNCLRGIKVWLCLFAYDAHGVVCVAVNRVRHLFFACLQPGLPDVW